MEHQNGAMIERKRAQRPLDGPFGIVPLREPLVGPRGRRTHGLVASGPARRFALGIGAAASEAEARAKGPLLACAGQHHAQRPDSKATRAQVMDGPEAAHDRLLGGLRGALLVAEKTMGHPVGDISVGGHELVVGIDIAQGGPLDQVRLVHGHAVSHDRS